MNFYVNGLTGDDANDGLTLETAKKTIQSCLTVATTPGDVVNVSASTYTGNTILLVNDGITLLGPNSEVNPVQSLESREAEAVLQGITIHVNASNCTIAGFKWDGASSSGECITSRKQDGVDSIVIRNNIMKEETKTFNYGVMPVVNGFCSNWRIEQNLIGPWSKANGTGIWLNSGVMSRSSDNIISNNNINCPSTSGSRGINCGDYQDNITVIGNIVVTYHWGIQIPSGNVGAKILNNTVSGQRTNIPILSYGGNNGNVSNLLIKDNIISNYVFAGILFWDSGPSLIGVVTNATISDNILIHDLSGLMGNWASIDLRFHQDTPEKATDILVENNKISFIGNFSIGGSAYGIKVRGSSLKDISILNNQVKGVGLSGISEPFTSGLWIEADDIICGKYTAETIVKDNEFVQVSNSVVVYDSTLLSYGGLTNSDVNVVQKFKDVNYGILSGIGGVIEAINSWWGSENGPSGGATCVNTGQIANGDGVKVSENVKWSPYISQGIYVPFVKPSRRIPGKPVSGLPPGGTPGSDSSQSSIEHAQSEGNIDVLVDGKSIPIFKGGAGNSVPYTNSKNGGSVPSKNAGVVMPWGDNPGRIDEPGKA
jgi:hypothetical protein